MYYIQYIYVFVLDGGVGDEQMPKDDGNLLDPKEEIITDIESDEDDQNLDGKLFFAFYFKSECTTYLDSVLSVMCLIFVFSQYGKTCPQ